MTGVSGEQAVRGPERYRGFAAYLRERFGGPTRRVSLAAGFSCPNRDGTLSADGCIFCRPESYTPFRSEPLPPLTEQLAQGIRRGQARGCRFFLAYFQPFSNTYGPLPELKAAYDVVRRFPEVRGLAIGTRPDCVNEEILSLIAGYAPAFEVWMEYGLQSIHDRTLERIHRGHRARDFLEAVALTRRHPVIRICAHVILGLPGETEEQERETAETLARLRLEGVKLHPLHVVSGTSLENEYREGRYQPLSQAEYVRRVVRFLERLWPQTVIQRLTADCAGPLLVAPGWLSDKMKIIRLIQARLEEEDTWQGKYYGPLK